MPNIKRSSKPGHITRGDIFDDLGMLSQEALEAKVKAEIWRDLKTHIERRLLDRTALQNLLKLHQPDVSNLLRGKISKFSTSKLITFAIRLDLQVKVQLKEPKTAKALLPSVSAAKQEIDRRSRSNREAVRA